jgi:hypothetical protein
MKLAVLFVMIAVAAIVAAQEPRRAGRSPIIRGGEPEVLDLRGGNTESDSAQPTAEQPTAYQPSAGETLEAIQPPPQAPLPDQYTPQPYLPRRGQPRSNNTGMVWKR